MGSTYRSVAELAAENPEAYEFPEPEAVAPHEQKPNNHPLYTAGTMLGGYTPHTSGFWIRPIKIRELQLLDRFIRLLASGELRRSPVMEQLDRQCEMLSKLLCVEEGESYRAATVEEVAAVFDPAEAAEILAEFAGIKRSASDPNV